jgi:MtN3 and saliva related transmembrane protein
MKAHRTKKTEDLSLGMLAIFSVGLLLWTVYGVLIGSLPVISANVATLALVMYILFLKVRHG